MRENGSNHLMQVNNKLFRKNKTKSKTATGTLGFSTANSKHQQNTPLTTPNFLHRCPQRKRTESTTLALCSVRRFFLNLNCGTFCQRLEKLQFYSQILHPYTDPVHMMKSCGCVRRAKLAKADWMRL